MRGEKLVTRCLKQTKKQYHNRWFWYHHKKSPQETRPHSEFFQTFMLGGVDVFVEINALKFWYVHDEDRRITYHTLKQNMITTCPHLKLSAQLLAPEVARPTIAPQRKPHTIHVWYMIYFPTFGWFSFMVNVGYVNIPYTWILWEGRHLNQPLIFTGRRQVTPMLCEDSARHPLPDIPSGVCKGHWSGRDRTYLCTPG